MGRCKNYRERIKFETLSSVRLTVVDISRDGEIWREYGYYAMQKSRAVGLLYEAWRQGGWFSYSELSSLLNMTPNALQSRLRDFEDSGVWLPHVGNERLGINQDFFPCVVVKEFLDGVSSSELRIGIKGVKRPCQRLETRGWI